MSCRELEFGFIEPGHGLKGKKQWIKSDEDIIMIETVEKYEHKKEIMLWCYSTSGERHFEFLYVCAPFQFFAK